MPHGVAIVGASEKSMWFGNFRRNLLTYGYDGEIWPVNPTTEAVHGYATFPSLSSIGQPLDAVAVMVGSERCPQVVEEAVGLGVDDIVVVAAGFAEIMTPEGHALQEQLVAACKPTTRLYGPNGVGFADFTNRLCLIGEPIPQEQPPGTVSILSQSGALLASIMAAVIEDGAGIDWCASLGNAAQFDMARAIDHIASRGTSKSICIYAETLGADVERLEAALTHAAESGISVVMLKAGRSPAAKGIAYSHTASVAGDDAETAAFLRALGVIRVDSLEEMARVAVLSPMRRPERGNGVAIVGSSGGQAAVAGELAHRDRLNLAALTDQTMELVRTVTEGSSSYVGNPFDLTGRGAMNAELFAAVYGDPNVGFVLSPWSITFPDHSVEQRHNQPLVRLAVQTAKETGTPTVISSLVNVPWTDWIKEVRAENPHVAIVRGIETTIRALSRLFPAGERDADDAHVASSGQDAGPGDAEATGLVGETEGRDILSGLGLPLVEGEVCRDAASAAAAAERLGFPVVVKVDVRGVAHRAKLGLVTVGCRDAADVRTAVEAAERSLAEHGIGTDDVVGVLVQRQASGSEVLLGLHRSALGAFLTVSPGGVLAGAGWKASTTRLPADPGVVRETIAATAGVDPDSPGAREASAAVVSLGEQFTSGGLTAYETVEVNPALVSSAGCTFVDVLMVRS